MYERSRLLASSYGLRWHSIAAELRAHGPGETRLEACRQAEITLIVAGNAAGLLTRTVMGQCQQAVPDTGSIWLSPMGAREPLSITAPIPQILHLFLPWSLFDRVSREFNHPLRSDYQIQYVCGLRDEVISHLGRSVLSELTNESSTGRAYVEAAAMALAARLLQKYCNPGTGSSIAAASQGLNRVRLHRVLDFIASHLNDDITLHGLAVVAGCSLYHFARKFTVSMGVPPHRYISRLRLELAMVELTVGRLPLAQIALNAQFSSQASFTRAFHRATGMTPKAYQRHHR